jgi:Mg-chelatase subunit ChlD
MNKEQITRWRLILGKAAEQNLEESGEVSLSAQQEKMDAALGEIYDDNSGDSNSEAKQQRKVGGLQKSAPALAKWLGDIRECFDNETVALVQKDAIERKGLQQLLYEPELLKNVEPDIHLITTLLSLKEQVPEETKDEVRRLIGKFVEELKESLRSQVEPHVRGVLKRSVSSPLARMDSINWSKTIRQSLKNYDPEKKVLYPEKIHYYGHQRKTANWHVFVDIDQSASMAESMVYAAVMGSIFSSLPAIRTRVVAFDTAVVDLTEECGDDPVDMLYGMQLGGGTDINRSITYCRQFIDEPERSIFILISDLFEGGNRQQMLAQMLEMKSAGVRVICLLTLSNAGLPYYDELIAGELAKADIACFGCTPEKLPDLVKKVLAGNV